MTAPSAADDAPEASEHQEVAEQPEPAEPLSKPAPGGLPFIITVLQRLDFPLRFLPSSMRVIVDWVAWSLIFWVPVVWVIAILVIGR